MTDELAQTMDLGAETEGAGEAREDKEGVEVRAERLESREEVIETGPIVEEKKETVTEKLEEQEVKPIVEALVTPDTEPVAKAKPEVETPASAEPQVPGQDKVMQNSGESNAEAKAAAALADAYKSMPGVVADLVRGNTVEEVKASYEAAQKAYSDIKAAVLQEQGVAVPSARGGSSLPPVPGDPLSMILAGVAQPKR